MGLVPFLKPKHAVSEKDEKDEKGKTHLLHSSTTSPQAQWLLATFIAL
jgi:hypothetical protein